MNHSEAAALALKAKKAGLTEATVIRFLVKSYSPKEKPDDRFYVVMRQLVGIGNNIQQICRKANALNFIDAPALSKEAEKWNDFWLEVRQKYLDPDRVEVRINGDN